VAVLAAEAHAELVESLDQQVRAAVRRDGVDPQRDALVVRRLAEAVVRAHDELSLTGVVAPVSDVDSMVGELVARVAGFGPLQPFLDDPSVEEIWINDPSRVFVARCEQFRWGVSDMQIIALAQVVAMAALAMNATAPTGDSWTPVAQTDESLYLLDEHSIERASGLLTAWELVEYALPQYADGVAYQSQANLRVYRCSDRSWDVLRVTRYSGPQRMVTGAGLGDEFRLR